MKFDVVFQAIDRGFDVEFQAIDRGFDVVFDNVHYIKGDTCEPYEGPYVVQSNFSVQTFETSNKKMTEDLVVLEIPMSEVSNLYGVTLNIGDVNNA